MVLLALPAEASPAQEPLSLELAQLPEREQALCPELKENPARGWYLELAEHRECRARPAHPDAAFHPALAAHPFLGDSAAWAGRSRLPVPRQKSNRPWVESRDWLGSARGVPWRRRPAARE